jgi:hypothetical protein
MAFRILRVLILLVCFSCVHLSGAAAWYCGPAVNCHPPVIPLCQPPVVPLGDWCQLCQPSPLFPPAPPVVAPVIVSPFPMAYGPPVAPVGPPPRHIRRSLGKRQMIGW